MSLSKYQLRQKQQRRAARLSNRDKHDSAILAFRTCAVIALNSAKVTWKSDASNPKLESFLIHMFKTWESIAEGELDFQTVIDSVEAESKLKYDPASGNFTNLKAKL